MLHLRALTIETQQAQIDEFPFNVPAIRHIEKLEFQSPVTILVGENGSGKSTLLEGIAAAVGSITIGREEIRKDKAFNAVMPLADGMKLVWNKRTHRGFFLRAEDFFGYIQRIRALRQEMLGELNRIDREYEARSDYAKLLAKGPAVSSIHAMDQNYGEDLDTNSHGESFLRIFQARFVPGGLYLLDEPEAALSPLRQLGLISLIKEMVIQKAQFILATHSPILMALPDAKILNLDHNPPLYLNYDQVESVSLYRAFLADPQAFVFRL